MSVAAKNHELSALATDAKDRMSGDLELLKDAFSQLHKDVLHVLHDARGVGKSTATGAADSAKSYLNDLKAAGADQVTAVAQRIGTHPVAIAGIAFGVGILISMILSHRK